MRDENEIVDKIRKVCVMQSYYTYSRQALLGEGGQDVKISVSQNAESPTKRIRKKKKKKKRSSRASNSAVANASQTPNTSMYVHVLSCCNLSHYFVNCIVLYCIVLYCFCQACRCSTVG